MIIVFNSKRVKALKKALAKKEKEYLEMHDKWSIMSTRFMALQDQNKDMNRELHSRSDELANFRKMQIEYELLLVDVCHVTNAPYMNLRGIIEKTISRYKILL